LDITAECNVQLDEHELDAICTALNAHDFHEFTLTIETQVGHFLPVLYTDGQFRDPTDMDWAIENILKVLDTIGWDVRRVEADPSTGEVDYHLTPGDHPNYVNTRDAVRRFQGGQRC
jgi:hypothetical protein